VKESCELCDLSLAVGDAVAAEEKPWYCER
jgi:hypothetical protein